MPEPSDVGAALLARDAASRSIGIEIVEVGAGSAVVRMTVRTDMVNGHGVCHGGLIFMLADSALAFACNSGNVNTLAASASIDFVRPARLGTRLVATAIAVHQRAGPATTTSSSPLRMPTTPQAARSSRCSAVGRARRAAP